MAGQARLTVNGRDWLASLAITPWELTQGMGGISGIQAGTGMLFDMGLEQTIQVTTVPMLFSLDIAFLSDNMVVTEVYRDIEPGYLVTSTSPARYFLEVNAGELTGVNAGDQASLEVISTQDTTASADWITPLVSFMGFALAGLFMVGIVGDFTGSIFTDTKKALLLSESKSNDSKNRCSFCRGSKSQCEVCERVSPLDYHLLSWVGVPVPDYSFAVEPETKERRIDEMLKRLKEGVDGIQQSDNFRQFLMTMSKFHDYSIGNLILIAMQKPDATRVAGFTTWKDLGRWVKRGERGIAILAPCFPPKQAKPESVESTEEETREEDQPLMPLFFKVVYVFDLSQTEGKVLPEFAVPSLTGEANETLFDEVLYLAKSEKMEVSFEPRPNQDPDIKGMYYGKNIWVKPDESRAQQLKTLIHEVAHYYSEGVFRIPRRDAETIAESVAFTVGAHFGFDTGTRSFPYVALWSQDKKVLEENLAAIRKVSAKIIDTLELITRNVAGVV
jgi:uncharacterized membrane protein (UPF0127 family)